MILRRLARLGKKHPMLGSHIHYWLWNSDIAMIAQGILIVVLIGIIGNYDKILRILERLG